MPDKPILPPSLREALREEEPDVQKDLIQLWTLLGSAPESVPTVPEEEAWQQLAAQLHTAPPRERASDRSAERPPRRVRRLRRLALAAAVPLALLLAFGAWWTRPVVATTAPGQTLAVALPDGSTATLNSGTTLRYARGFDRLPFLAADARRVILEGEAHFAVERGAAPFIVETFNADVTVLGTVFTVRARRGFGEATTRVSVHEGRVRVSGPTDDAVELSPDQETLVTEASAPTPPAPTEAARADAWRRGGFAVKDLPLAAVFAEIERRYATRVETEGRLGTGSVTLYLSDPENAEAVVRDLCAARGLRYRPTSQGFLVWVGGN